MWIKVTDKMPKAGIMVLWFGKRNTRKGKVCDMFDVAAWPTHFNFTPSHWFQFPSPPTEDNAEGANLQPLTCDKINPADITPIDSPKVWTDTDVRNANLADGY